MALAYPTLSEFKTDLGISGSSEDSYLTTQLAAAKAFIERYSGRAFAVPEGAWKLKYYPVRSPYISGRTLTFFADVAVMDVVINGDGQEFAGATDFILYPQDSQGVLPATHLILNDSLTFARSDGTINDGKGVAVSAVWGYSTYCPDDIFQATLEIARFYYRVRQTGLPGAVSNISDTGKTALNSALPEYVLQVLESYRRKV